MGVLSYENDVLSLSEYSFFPYSRFMNYKQNNMIFI